MDYHEAAAIFPMDDEHIPALAKDIKAHGQQVPIELLDGKVLDGRRRWMACMMARVAPITVDVNPDDPITHVRSLNEHRRHMTVTQLSMVAAKVKKYYDEQARERMQAGKGADGSGGRGKKRNPTEDLPEGLSRDAAGKAFGVSGKSVDNASRVLNSGCEELIKAVEQDKIAVSTAARLASRTPEEQKATLDNAAKGKRRPRPTEHEVDDTPPDKNSKPGVGVMEANKAINILMRIPKNDPLRKRGFQIVSDWIKSNR